MMRIVEHRDETPSTKTMVFDEGMRATSGQFVMVWVPGVDEFPMSVSYSGERLGITYQVIGEGTRALAARKVGDRIGVRGPYGKGFAIRGKRLLVVGGGLGMAPLGLFVEEAAEHGAKLDIVLGARTSGELLFEERCARTGSKVHISTDDGTRGLKGFATELAATTLERDRFECVYTCGPEKMIVGLLGIADKKGIPMQASLERIMKCGIGVCDSCALDGRHVCRDGPVFNERDLRSFSDLGKTKLDTCGRKTAV
jgi:dihydroorotate dehydrogenase electron transfer subunit